MAIGARRDAVESELAACSLRFPGVCPPMLEHSCRNFHIALAMTVTTSVTGHAQPRASEPPAQSDPEQTIGFEATAKIQRPLPAANSLDVTAAGTETSALRSAAAELRMPELLLALPGVDVRQTGSTGAGAFVTLRGANSNQTAFLLGDLPLGSPDMGPLDLALLDAMGFGTVEVYRGGAPAWLNSGAIGGVVRLMPPRGDRSRTEFALSGGSFRQWRLRGASTVRAPRFRFSTVANLDGAVNDFAFADDNGTAFDPTDDGESRRVNAHTLGSFLLSYLEADVGESGTVSAVVHNANRRGGDPGPAQATAERTDRGDVRLGGVIAYDHDFARGKLQIAAGGGVRQQEVSDPFQEIGLDRNVDRDRFRDATGRIAGVAHVYEWLDATVVGSLRYLDFEPSNRLGTDLPQSHRVGMSATAELRAHGKVGDRHPVGLELRVSSRIDHQRTEAVGTRLGRTTIDRSNDTRPTFRAAGAIAPLPWISFVGSVASGTRFATFLELFGNASTILPSPGLSPEQSRSVDGGIVLRGTRGEVQGRLEARIFELRIKEIIRTVPTSQNTVVFQNEDRATNRGVELGAKLIVNRHVHVGGSATAMRTRTADGLELNWRPRLQAQLQPELHSGSFANVIRDAVVFAGVLHRGAYFNDPANLVEVNGWTWLSAGVRVDMNAGFSLACTVRDLLDQRGQDFLGFPLPGRRFAIELRHRMEI